MIKANELRVGNKLHFYRPLIIEKQILTVTGIGKENEGYFVYSDKYAGINEEGLMGIPLTEQLLEKCGFVKSIFEGSDQLLSKKIVRHNPYTESQMGIMYNNFIGFYFSSFINVQIKYLHHLQNLYLALTGEELEIKL